MTLSKDRVIVQGVSPHPHEVDAIEFLKSALPDHESILLWALVELVANGGRRYEIDALVTGPHALYLVEIKSWPGVVEGDVVDWKVRFPDGHVSVYENPLRLTSLKARVLGSLLDKKMQGQRPWIEPLIFLGHSEVQNKLTETARSGVVARDRVVQAIAEGKVPGGESRMLSKPYLTRQTRQELIAALRTLGVAASKGAMRLGDLMLGDIIGEGPGYQDREAVHESMKQMQARVRSYLVPQSPTLERREQLRRAAEREVRTLTILGDNPNVLRVQSYTADGPTAGPCITFERFERGIPLDAFLRTHPDLPFEGRISIIEQLASALDFCHRKQVLHRGLHPGAVLVRHTHGESGPLQVKLTDFALSAQGDGSQGTVHLSALSTEPASVYRAPEVIENPTLAAPESDVFSLGAIAYFVLSGKPPGGSIAERQKLLDAGGGHLSLSAATDTEAALDEVIGLATEASAIARADSAADWLNLLLEHTTQPEPRAGVDPLEARPGDELDGKLRVVRILGTGSTARVLLVERGNAQQLAMKVPLTAELQDRLEVEAQALERLKSDRIVALRGRIELNDRPCLLLEYAGETLSILLQREGPVSLDYAARWGEDLLLALQHLEENGVQHRDIKPGNLGVLEGASKSKKARHLLLFDFSLAGATTSTEIGTAVYRDPFVFKRGHWDTAADRWSAAFTLYEMVTAVRARFGTGEAAATSITDEITIEADRFDPSVRDRLVGFFRKALRRDVTQRHDSAEEMRKHWLSCFAARIDDSDAAQAGITIESVTATTPVEAMPLSARGKNALDRAGVMTARQLVQLPRNQLSAMRGIGREVAREIFELVARLQAAGVGGDAQPFFPGAAAPEPLARVPGLSAEAASRLEDAGLTRMHEVAAADKELVERQVQPFPGAREALLAWLETAAKHQARVGHPTTIEAWVDALLPKKDKDLRALFGLEPLDGKWFNDVRSLAHASGKTPQAVYLALSRARGRWAGHSDIASLQESMTGALGKVSDVAPLARVGTALQALLPHEANIPPDAATRNEQGLARILCELAASDDEDAGPAFVRLGEGGWVGATKAHVHAARRLGAIADDLASRESPPAFEQSREALQRAVASTPLASLSAEALVALAAEASRKAAVSARLEIYPRGLSPERALRLSQGALAATPLTPDAVRAAVRSRYADAQPLPDRPKLDALLSPLGLMWNEGAGAYERPGGQAISTSHTEVLPPRRPTAHSDRPRPPPSAGVLDAEDFDANLRRDAQRGYFRVFDVIAPWADEAALRIAERLDTQPLPLDKALIEAALELAGQMKIDPAAVYRADRAGPDSPDWVNLSALMTKAADRVLQRLSSEPRRLVLTRPGLLARFQLDRFLGELIEVSERKDAPALFFVNPIFDDGAVQPVRGSLKDLPIPLTSPGQRVRVPQAWLENLHRGTA